MESCCIYIYVLWIPSRTVVQCYYFVFHPHESAWWAPLNRFYTGLAGFAKTCIGPILRVLHSGDRKVSIGLYVSRWDLSLPSWRDILRAHSVIDINTDCKHVVKELITK